MVHTTYDQMEKRFFFFFSTKKKSILVYVTIIVELNVYILYTVMEKHIVCNTTNKRNTLEDKKSHCVLI